MGTRRALTSRWWFRTPLLLVAIFLPVLTQVPFDPAQTSLVIADILKNPLIHQWAPLLPFAKLVLLAVTVAAFRLRSGAAAVVLVYYAVVLVVLAVLQNMSSTEHYGFAWVIGNTLIMLVVAVRCGIDVTRRESDWRPTDLVVRRLWVLAPMALAFLMPYTIVADAIRPSFGLELLTNSAGLTYCMVTPVIIGLLVLFSARVSPATLSLVSFVGLYFGIVNLVTWWVLLPASWWMGVLHVPLFLLAIYGLVVARSERRKPGRDAAPQDSS
ncbi:hypothetical protein BH09ACT3_BH09ACT3_09550 [soil metagenome]